MGLMFGEQHFSIDTIKKLGQKKLAELPDLTEQIKKKYVHLGDFANE
jgi:hypothetical protein